MSAYVSIRCAEHLFDRKMRTQENIKEVRRVVARFYRDRIVARKESDLEALRELRHLVQNLNRMEV